MILSREQRVETKLQNEKRPTSSAPLVIFDQNIHMSNFLGFANNIHASKLI